MQLFLSVWEGAHEQHSCVDWVQLMQGPPSVHGADQDCEAQAKPKEATCKHLCPVDLTLCEQHQDPALPCLVFPLSLSRR